MQNGSESRDLNRGRLSTGATAGKSQTKPQTVRVTINEPWKLDLPQRVADHFEQTSALTGIEPSKLIAAAIVQQFNSAEAEKKKPEAKGQIASFSGPNAPRDSKQNSGPVQLMLQLVSGSDKTAS